jgi:mono/diheme cytochrome c family protein
MEKHAVDMRKILEMSQAELDELFLGATAGAIPNGRGKGTAIIFPGTILERIKARIVWWLLWRGKVFDAAQGTLVNIVSVLGVRAIRAQVYKAASWLDGKECIVLDYSQTSRVARKIRDEIREVATGLYLGKVYWGKKRTIDFALDFKKKIELGPIIRVAALFLLTVLAVYAVWRVQRNSPVTYAEIEEHFKYGSTGGEIEAGIPYAVWKALPHAFPQYLPAAPTREKPYSVFGFIYEPGHDLPVGVSQRNVQGLDRVFLNCAVCHAGTVRSSPEAEPRVYLGMPANTVDLQAFQNFLFRCAAEGSFTSLLVPQIDAQGGEGLDLLNRFLMKNYAVYVLKDRLLQLRDLFAFSLREPPFGPGRFDTFNPPKALLHFPMDKVPRREWVGAVDFPSIWLQGPRKSSKMQLHWDGNNRSVEERNRSAAFGTGAFPPTLDRESVRRVEDWLLTREPDKYPFPRDEKLSAQGANLYATHCSHCHGKDGRDFTGSLVGSVTDIEDIRTDRSRLDSYSDELCASQNTLYAGYEEERFQHFRKTHGYANMPLDGIWLRAPYLHNGSVPTLRDLLEPPEKRPKSFYRGCDVYDPKRVGFVQDVAQEGGRTHFLYKVDEAGNGNSGHEYATNLSGAEKDAIVEYLKGF